MSSNAFVTSSACVSRAPAGAANPSSEPGYRSGNVATRAQRVDRRRGWSSHFHPHYGESCMKRQMQQVSVWALVLGVAEVTIPVAAQQPAQQPAAPGQSPVVIDRYVVGQAQPPVEPG